jgi:hypothetical protein
MLRSLSLLALLVVVPGSAHAQQQPAPFPAPFPFVDARGTAEDQKACRGDATKLCRDSLSGGDMAVLQCFKANRPRLSASCDAVLRKYGQ